MKWSPAYEGDFPSLGWGIIEAWADLFPSPRDESSPFVLTDEQARIIVEWYAVDIETGRRFVYRRGCSRRSKGVGKSPIEAAKCITELALPCSPDGFDANGQPVARPWGTGGLPTPWIQIAARSEDQDENTWSPLYYLLTAADGAAADALGVDAGLTRCYLKGKPGAKIEPVSSAGGSREGQPITYGCLDETGYMLPTNGGVKLAKTVRKNATKMGGRVYETTNGFMPGEGSIAEQTHKAALITPDIYYDAIEAPESIDGIDVTADAPDHILRKALSIAYGDRWWVDIDRIVADVRDPDADWHEAERFFFNWNRKGEGKAVDPKVWDALAREQQPEPGSKIAIGFDGSISGDCTVLIGCTPDGFSWTIRAWERPRDSDHRPVKDWRVPRMEVHEAVRRTFAEFDVGLMLCDPPKWYEEIEGWQHEYGPERVLPFDTFRHGQMARAVDRWRTSIREGSHTWRAGDDLLRAHVLASQLKKVRVNAPDDDDRTMYVIVKGDDGRKIDAAVADILAYEAACTIPELAPKKPIFAY